MIVSVTTNLKRLDGKPKTYKLGLKTLVVGRSASGKSAVTQAVELAVGGKMSDYLGRAESSERTVKSRVVAPDEERGLVATITTDGGAVEEGVTRLIYAPALDAILSNPIDAHVALLGETLPADARATHAELKTEERHKREVSAKATAVRTFVERARTVGLDGAALATIEAEAVTFENEVAGLDGKLDRLRDELRHAIELAWTPRVQSAVSRFVPARLGRFVVDTSIGFGFGLQRPNKLPRWAPSGSEWNILVSALALRTANTDADVLIPADRAIDRGLLVEWMKVLTKTPAQVILTCVEAPEKIPAGWTVLAIR